MNKSKSERRSSGRSSPEGATNVIASNLALSRIEMVGLHTRDVLETLLRSATKEATVEARNSDGFIVEVGHDRARLNVTEQQGH